MALTRKAQEIVDSIAQDRAALLGSIRDLAPAQTDFRVEPGSWSIDDVLHHLALTEEANSKLMGLFQKRAGEESIGPDPSPGASVLDCIDALVEGTDEGKAPAPDRVTPRSKVEAPEAVARLEAARSRVLASVEALCTLDATRLTFQHPFFGELDLYQWLLIGGWHERRHTRQIERIKTSSGFPRS